MELTGERTAPPLMIAAKVGVGGDVGAGCRAPLALFDGMVEGWVEMRRAVDAELRRVMESTVLACCVSSFCLY